MSEVDEKIKLKNENIECQAYGVCNNDSLTKTLQHCSLFGLKIFNKDEKLS